MNSTVNVMAIRCDACNFALPNASFGPAPGEVNPERGYVGVDLARKRASYAGWGVVVIPKAIGPDKVIDLCPDCRKMHECPSFKRVEATTYANLKKLTARSDP